VLGSTHREFLQNIRQLTGRFKPGAAVTPCTDTHSTAIRIEKCLLDTTGGVCLLRYAAWRQGLAMSIAPAGSIANEEHVQIRFSESIVKSVLNKQYDAPEASKEKVMNKKIRNTLAAGTLLTAFMSAPAMAFDNDTWSSALGGGLGGAIGAAVGNEIGGRNGALIGSAVGAAGGTLITNRQDDDRYDDRYDDRRYYDNRRGRGRGFGSYFN